MHSVLIIGTVLIYANSIIATPPDSGNECDNNRGICQPIAQCDPIFKNYHILHHKVKFCDEFNAIVCCPKPDDYTEPTQVGPRNIHEAECLKFHKNHHDCPAIAFIVNGQKAEPKEFPFMALIGLKDNETQATAWICGGTLISEKYVLTAAHCLVTNDQYPVFRVRLGELDYAVENDDAKPQEFGIKNYVLHPKYEDEELNDIALMELNGRATFNDYVQPACLPSSDGSEHSQLTAIGWGNIKDAGQSSSHLLKVTLERYTDDYCLDKLKPRVLNLRTQICAGSHSSSSDTCQGDSGGPLFVQHPTHRCLKQIFGVTSYGFNCGQAGVPSIYTRVHLYTDWIEKIVWDV